MMARAASVPATGPPPRAITIGAISGMTVSIGNGMPIRPVWQTRTSSAAATEVAGHGEAEALRRGVRPAAPVAALALPDVRMTPAARPPVAARWARLTWTGARRRQVAR